MERGRERGRDLRPPDPTANLHLSLNVLLLVLRVPVVVHTRRRKLLRIGPLRLLGEDRFPTIGTMGGSRSSRERNGRVRSEGRMGQGAHGTERRAEGCHREFQDIEGRREGEREGERVG